jgi:hypothetical protein
MAENDTTHQEHLRQVTRGQFVAQPLERHEGNDVSGILVPVQKATAAHNELPAAVATAEPAAAVSRMLRFGPRPPLTR